MRKIKNGKQGFTLIEVIVVAIIVAVLASVAVPIYLSYVQNSKVNQANNIAGAVASFCGACGADASECEIHTLPGVEVGGKAVCPGNGTSILLPQGFDVTITGTVGDGSVAAQSKDDETLISLNYEF